MAKTMYSWGGKYTNYTYHNILLLNWLCVFMYSLAFFPKKLEKVIIHEMPRMSYPTAVLVPLPIPSPC